MRLAPAWQVQIAEHEVARWSIEAQVVEVNAINETQARIAAAREVHRRLGIPGWKPWMRASYLRTRVLASIEHPDRARRRTRRRAA